MRSIAWMAMALITSPLAAQDTKMGEDARAVFEKLQAEFNRASSEYMARVRETGERMDRKVVAEPFFAQFDGAAKRYRGTDDAIPFLGWILINYAGDQDKVDAVIEEVLDHHIESQALLVMAGSFANLAPTIGEDRATELRRRIMAEGHDEVKATMLFFSGYYASINRNATEESMAAAMEDLRKAAEIGGEYGEMAAGMLFERENLQIGMEAPDIVGEDLDGVEFSLSDYRGKVVVLDFWGDW